MAPVTTKMTSNCTYDNKTTICAICLVDLGDGNATYLYDKTCKLVKCNHRFHINCIKKWFKYGRYHCPYCRRANYNINADLEVDRPT